MAYKYNDGSRSDELIKKMIPVMVLWSMYSWTEKHTYGDLANLIGAKTPRLGLQLGYIHKLFNDIAIKHNRKIPTLNALISNANTSLPSNGLDYVDKSYSKLGKEPKEKFVIERNLEAHNYDYSWVLKVLGLTLPTNLPSSIIKYARKTTSKHNGGEGEYHKKLKNIIINNPERLGIKNVIKSSLEYGLISGDRLDVYFKTKDNQIWAIEAKSHISDDTDILRGIYQCVKYKAVLEAEKAVTEDNSEIKTLLLLEDKIPIKLAEIAYFLKVEYLDNFKIYSSSK